MLKKEALMNFTRLAEKKLTEWKNRSHRKPLVVRGARQVGKTTLVKKFGAGFRQFLYLNLETSDSKFFKGEKDIHHLVDRVFFEFNLDKAETDTLIFIDEIQAVPEALSLLRYFYEEFPDYYVVAAGSLLESLFKKNISFPVGRVEYLYIYPLNFEEFLSALGEEQSLFAYNTVPCPDYAVEKLMGLFHTYVLIGGMPEIVADYIQHKDLRKLGPVYQALLLSYSDDVEKYADTLNQMRVMRHLIKTIYFRAGERVKFAGFGESDYASKDVGEGLRTLEKALLLHLIYPTTQTEPPFLPNLKKMPRLQVLDCGILNYAAGIQHDVFDADDLNNLYKGRLMEQAVGQELLCRSDDYLEPLSFWVREKNTSNAEVDFLLKANDGVIPVEVKSGATGRLKSLAMFMKTSGNILAFRLHKGHYDVEQINTEGHRWTLVNLPYVFAGKIGDYTGK